jgi:hypothetical protein
MMGGDQYRAVARVLNVISAIIQCSVFYPLCYRLSRSTIEGFFFIAGIRLAKQRRLGTTQAKIFSLFLSNLREELAKCMVRRL